MAQDPNFIQPPNSPDQIYSQYQTAVKQLQILDSQQTQLSGLIKELDLGITTLHGLENHDANSEVVLPLTNSILIKAKLTGPKEVLLSIGSDVLLPSSIQEATDHIQARRDELTVYFEKNAKDRVQLENISSQLQSQLNQMGIQS